MRCPGRTVKKMSVLTNVNTKQNYNETQKNNFLEEIIVHPDGMVTGSWNKKTLVIHKP